MDDRLQSLLPIGIGLDTYAREAQDMIETVMAELGAGDATANLVFVNKSEKAFCTYQKGFKQEHDTIEQRSILTEAIKTRRKFICQEPHRYWNAKIDTLEGIDFQKRLPVY